MLKGKHVIEGRPGSSLGPMDLTGLEYRLKEKYGVNAITNRDVLSAALYPKVFDEYMTHTLKYSDLIEKLPTRSGGRAGSRLSARAEESRGKQGCDFRKWVVSG